MAVEQADGDPDVDLRVVHGGGHHQRPRLCALFFLAHLSFLRLLFLLLHLDVGPRLLAAGVAFSAADELLLFCSAISAVSGDDVVVVVVVEQNVVISSLQEAKN